MTRRHELDWLRVLLFALLVPHHVAIGFVDWGVDIYKFVNDRLAGDGMTLFIYWSHSWRLPSLFMIAGLGTWFLTARGIGIRFMGPRLLRLLAPHLCHSLHQCIRWLCYCNDDRYSYWVGNLLVGLAS